MISHEIILSALLGMEGGGPGGVFQFHSQELDNLSIHLIFIPSYLNISRSSAKAVGVGDQETALHFTSLVSGHCHRSLMRCGSYCIVAYRVSSLITYPRLGRTRFARLSFLLSYWVPHLCLAIGTR